MNHLKEYQNMYQYYRLIRTLEKTAKGITILQQFRASNDIQDSSLNHQIEEQKREKEILKEKTLDLLNADLNLIHFNVSEQNEYLYCESCKGNYPKVLNLKTCVKCEHELHLKKGDSA